MRLTIAWFLLVVGCLSALAQGTTLHSEMLRLQARHHVHFVYESRLNLSVPYKGCDTSGLTLRQSLDAIFKTSGINYRQKGRNIMLWQDINASKSRVVSTPARPQRFRLRGLVRDSVGEPLVNVSLYDHTSKTGTLTDEHGHYSMILDTGQHTIDVSWFGQKRKTLKVNITKDAQADIVISGTMQISEVTVTSDINSPLNTTQTGKHTFRPDDIITEFSLLSSPDLVKTLQRMSGVAQGMELSGGLIVHGGSQDENLFLLDGTPIYQTNHSLGLFSAFNTDIIKNVDFYKSGFPARYSGRVSSVTDVQTKDGNIYEHHGSLSLGLIDGRMHFEGPLVKGRTSYDIALRRSWIDLLLKPAYALINSGKEEGEKFGLNYAFYDFNAKLTHKVGQQDKLWLSFYSGRDNYGVEDNSVWSDYHNDSDNKFKWGNINATLGGDFQLSKSLSFKSFLMLTNSNTNQNTNEDDYNVTSSGIRVRTCLSTNKNKTKMSDIGFKANFLYLPHPHHSVRFGGSFILHKFNPQTTTQAYYFGDPSEHVDTTGMSYSTKVTSHEAQIYAEDDVTISQWLAVNAGASLTIYGSHDYKQKSFDPRLSLRWHPVQKLTFKLSYSHMSQGIHRIASTFLDIPSDFWVPSTAAASLAKSDQLAAGVYVRPAPRLSVSLEGYAKHTTGLLQYRHWMGLQPPAALWEQNVTTGKGLAYGLELEADYKSPRITAQLSYTLSWSRRNFPELYDGWFYDQFDNRHRLNVTVRAKVSKWVSAYAALTLRNGNRVSFPLGTADTPQLPGDRQDFGDSYYYIYGKPNNMSLPLYHRMDLGLNISNRHHGVWNISVYNVYCHLNTMYAKMKTGTDGSITAKAKGYVPIIPSVSYTFKF